MAKLLFLKMFSYISFCFLYFYKNSGLKWIKPLSLVTFLLIIVKESPTCTIPLFSLEIRGKNSLGGKSETLVNILIVSIRILCTFEIQEFKTGRGNIHY